MEIILYTKDPCPLCDEVKAHLDGLHDTYPHTVREVDITAERDLYLRYRYAIPVVTIGETTLHAPITQMQLAAALRRNG